MKIIIEGTPDEIKIFLAGWLPLRDAVQIPGLVELVQVSETESPATLRSVADDERSRTFTARPASSNTNTYEPRPQAGHKVQGKKVSTKELDEKILTYHGQGLKDPEIARKLAEDDGIIRSPKTVQDRRLAAQSRSRLGITEQPHTGKIGPDGLDERIVKMRDVERLTFEAIHEQLRSEDIPLALKTVQGRYYRTKKERSLQSPPNPNGAKSGKPQPGIWRNPRSQELARLAQNLGVTRAVEPQVPPTGRNLTDDIDLMERHGLDSQAGLETDDFDHQDLGAEL